ncbi:MAG: hypothetical protein Ct9H90mP16_02370 [Candidatus Poseidoniales archaeon]|nr:MAG: hypothetical protein Ct9H90mP16_02370 [Candidatus Poseidoniales archaeon]
MWSWKPQGNKADAEHGGELTRDASKPTVAVVGVGRRWQTHCRPDRRTIAADNHNAVEFLNSIASHIGGGGGGRPTFAQGGGSNAEGLGRLWMPLVGFLGL